MLLVLIIFKAYCQCWHACRYAAGNVVARTQRTCQAAWQRGQDDLCIKHDDVMLVRAHEICDYHFHYVKISSSHPLHARTKMQWEHAFLSVRLLCEKIMCE